MDSALTDPRFYLVAVPAVIILGIGKGGFAGIGMISLPLMSLVFPPLQAASIMLPILVIQDAYSVWLYRRTWDRESLVVLLPGAAFGVLLGYILAAEVSVRAVELTLGIISVGFGARQLLLVLRPTDAAGWKPGRLVGTLCGIAAGFTSMIAHSGAPPFQIYTIPRQLNRDFFVGTSVVFFAAMNWLKIAPYLALGQITASNMALAATLIPIALAATRLGVYLVRKVNGPAFFIIIYASMILLGLKLISRAMT